MKLSAVNFNALNYSFNGSREINQNINAIQKELTKESDELYKTLQCLSNYAFGQYCVVEKDNKSAEEIVKKMDDVSAKYADKIRAYMSSPEVHEDILNELVQAGVGFADAKEFVDDGAKISEYLMFRPGGEIHDECYGEDELSPLLSYLAAKNGCFRNVNSFLDFLAMYEKLGDECEAKIYSDKGSQIDDFISFIDESEDEFEHDYSVYKPSIISDLLDKKYKYTYFHEGKQKQVKGSLLPEEFVEEFRDQIMAFATPEERIAYLQENLK